MRAAEGGRGTLLLIALVAGILVSMPLRPELAAALAIPLAVVWARLPRGEQEVVRGAFERYHATPITRAADCVAGVGRHGAATLRGGVRSQDAADVLLCLAYLALIIGPPLIVKALHHPALGHVAGIAVGLLAWETLLDLSGYRGRLAAYRGVARPPVSVTTILVLFAIELGVLVAVFQPGGLDQHSVARGIMVGIAAIAFGDVVCLLSTLVALRLGGRPFV